MDINEHIKKLTSHGYRVGNRVYNVTDDDGVQISIYAIHDANGVYLTNLWYKKNTSGMSVAIETTGNSISDDVEQLRAILKPSA